MVTYNKTYTLLLPFLLYKSRFVAHDLGYKAKKKGKR